MPLKKNEIEPFKKKLEILRAKIPKARLEAVPYATMTLEVQQEFEKR